MTIKELLMSMPDYIGGKGCSQDEIDECEKKLGLKFAADYREYLLTVGLACFENIELTGICKSARLNVVSATLREKESDDSIPKNYYLINDCGIDGLLIWQSSSGKVYMTSPTSRKRKIAESFEEFISSLK